MAGMTLKRRERARTGGRIYCHDECDPCMSPRKVKRLRRRLKRRERQAWKKEN